MPKMSRDDLRTNLGLLIINENISDRSTLRAAAKAAGLYTSEGSFSRDLATLRKEYGGTKEFVFTGRTNNGGGRKSLVINGVKMKIRKRRDGDSAEGFKIKKKGNLYEIEYSGGGGGGSADGEKSSNAEDDIPDDQGDDYIIDDPLYMSDDGYDNSGEDSGESDYGESDW